MLRIQNQELVAQVYNLKRKLKAAEDKGEYATAQCSKHEAYAGYIERKWAQLDASLSELSVSMNCAPITESKSVNAHNLLRVFLDATPYDAVDVVSYDLRNMERTRKSKNDRNVQDCHKDTIMDQDSNSSNSQRKCLLDSMPLMEANIVKSSAFTENLLRMILTKVCDNRNDDKEKENVIQCISSNAVSESRRMRAELDLLRQQLCLSSTALLAKEKELEVANKERHVALRYLDKVRAGHEGTQIQNEIFEYAANVSENGVPISGVSINADKASLNNGNVSTIDSTPMTLPSSKTDTNSGSTSPPSNIAEPVPLTTGVAESGTSDEDAAKDLHAVEVVGLKEELESVRMELENVKEISNQRLLDLEKEGKKLVRLQVDVAQARARASFDITKDDIINSPLYINKVKGMEEKMVRFDAQVTMLNKIIHEKDAEISRLLNGTSKVCEVWESELSKLQAKVEEDVRKLRNQLVADKDATESAALHKVEAQRALKLCTEYKHRAAMLEKQLESESEKNNVRHKNKKESDKSGDAGIKLLTEAESKAEIMRLKTLLHDAQQDTDAAYEELTNVSDAFEAEVKKNASQLDLIKKYDFDFASLLSEKIKADTLVQRIREEHLLEGEKMRLATDMASDFDKVGGERAKQCEALTAKNISIQNDLLRVQHELTMTLQSNSSVRSKNEALSIELSEAKQRLASLDGFLEESGEKARNAQSEHKRALELVGSLKRKHEKMKKKYQNSKHKKSKASSDGGPSYQDLMEALRCQVCHDAFKDRVIARDGCYHMLCKGCVEKNLKNRTRKCPSCNGPFSASDVKPMSILQF